VRLRVSWEAGSFAVDPVFVVPPSFDSHFQAYDTSTPLPGSRLYRIKVETIGSGRKYNKRWEGSLGRRECLTENDDRSSVVKVSCLFVMQRRCRYRGRFRGATQWVRFWERPCVYNGRPRWKASTKRSMQQVGQSLGRSARLHSR
jgi:hypothetical protein